MNCAAESVLRPMIVNSLPGAPSFRALMRLTSNGGLSAVPAAVEPEIQHQAVHRGGVHQGQKPAGRVGEAFVLLALKLVVLHVYQP